MDQDQRDAQAQATERAIAARGRLARGWPIVALVAGLLGVGLALLIVWLV